MNNARALITAWRSELDGETVVGVGAVQDHLLGLWGELGEAVDAILSPWLDATRSRGLFTVDELTAMLDDIEGQAQPVPV